MRQGSKEEAEAVAGRRDEVEHGSGLSDLRETFVDGVDI